MTKVLILGSGPNAELQKADVIYCANTSASYHTELLPKEATIKCVVGSHIIAAGPHSQAPAAVKAARLNIALSTTHQFIILDHNPWFGGWDLGPGIAELEVGSGRGVRIISRVERSEIMDRTSGLREPILSRTLWIERQRLGTLTFLKHAFRLGQQLRKNKQGLVTETHEVLRPSTGLIAAMIAIDEHGDDAEYVLSGISLSVLSDRSLHASGQSQGRFRGFMHHKHADIRVFKALEQRYNIRDLSKY